MKKFLLTSVAVIGALCYIASPVKSFPAVTAEAQSASRVYECDYHTLSLFKTKITTEIDGKDVEIKGKFKLFSDPLTMTVDGNKVGKSSDEFHFITQDSHDIVVDGKTEIYAEGKFAIAGDKYKLYDANDNVVATAKFTDFGHVGYIMDNDGKMIAKKTKTPFMNDYKVTIYDNDIASDEAILMMFADYTSDSKFDMQNSKSKSDD